jgi:hypothetical protein
VLGLLSTLPWRRMEEWTSALDGCECWASCVGRLWYPFDWRLGGSKRRSGGRVGPRDALESGWVQETLWKQGGSKRRSGGCGIKKVLAFAKNRTPDYQLVACRYTDFAILTLYHPTVLSWNKHKENNSCITVKCSSLIQNSVVLRKR